MWRACYTWRSRGWECEEPGTPWGAGDGDVRSLEHLEEQTAIQWPGRSKGNIWGSCFLASNRMFCPDVFTETLQEQRQAWVLVNVDQSVSFERCSLLPLSCFLTAVWVPEQQIPSPWPAVSTKSCLCCTSCSTMLIVPRAFLTKHPSPFKEKGKEENNIMNLTLEK